MNPSPRYLQDLILEDALKDHKIAFVSGPRQVGKTTLAKSILKTMSPSSYYTWDDDDFRKVWIQHPKDLIQNNTLIVFDEIHKDRKWKTKIKGLYDLFKDDLNFIVTGSARLDLFRKTGESLQGRYFPYRLHPFTAAESSALKPPPQSSWLENSGPILRPINDLLRLGGFPEPFLGASEAKAHRWRKLYRERLIREDLRELSAVREITELENLSLILPGGVSSPLSYESLRRDLSCSFLSVKRWIELLESLYYCYRIKPFSRKIKNSLKKEPKLYMYDWALVEEDSARWENFIANHLLKNVHAWTDAAFGNFELHYIRDKQKREVDFLVTNHNKPYLLLECKSNSKVISPALAHFTKILQPKFSIQIHKDTKLRPPRIQDRGIQVLPAELFLSALN